MKSKTLLGFISEKYKEPTVCESCGDEFVCGATIKGCWCFKIDLSEQTRGQLKSNFENCLCQNCLISFQNKE